MHLLITNLSGKTVNKGFDYRIFSDSFIEFKDEHFFIDLLYDVNGAK